jgi:hypothetical protein
MMRQGPVLPACHSAGNIRIPSPEISGKSTAALADSMITVLKLPFYPKYFHILAGHLLGRGHKKARAGRACIKKQILQYGCACGALCQPILG